MAIEIANGAQQLLLVHHAHQLPIGDDHQRLDAELLEELQYQIDRTVDGDTEWGLP